MTSNSRIFLLLEGIRTACGGFILPIYVLYFRYYHVTLFEVALLAVIFEASVLIFEIPTGLLADRFGRKQSVVLGYFLFALSGLIFVLWRDLNGFIFAEILFGLSEALISGAGEALAVDSIEPDKRAEALPRLFTLRSRIRIAVITVAMLLAGYAFSHNQMITFYPIVAGGFIGFLVAFGFRPTPACLATGRQSGRLWEPIRIMIHKLKTDRVIPAIFFLALVANFAFEGVDQFWQIFLSDFGEFEVSSFGWLTATGAVVAFFAVGPMVKKTSGNLTVIILLLLVTGVIISSLPTAPWETMVPFILVLYFVMREVISPLFSTAINLSIESAGRATFLSAFNMTCSVGEVISGLLVGLIASYLGLPIVFLFCGTVLVLASVGGLIFFVKPAQD